MDPQPVLLEALGCGKVVPIWTPPLQRTIQLVGGQELVTSLLTVHLFAVAVTSLSLISKDKLHGLRYTLIHPGPKVTLCLSPVSVPQSPMT